MKKLFKLILNPIRFIIGLVIFFFFRKNTNFGYQGMVASFCSTRGLSNRLVHSIVKYFKKKYNFEEPISGVLGNLEKEKLVHIVDEIKEKGYYVFEQKLSKETCNELLSFGLETQAYVRPVDTFNNSAEGTRKLKKIKLDRSNPIGIRYEFIPEQLLQNEEIQKLLADMSLIAVAQEYLECKPKSDVLGMWWHTSFSKKENKTAATMYHFDMDRIKWIKFFFYLTDTNKDNGAHQFIRGSHDGNIPNKFLKKGYQRLNTEDVINYYGSEKEITYEAPCGTIIAEDTSGLHRGNPVKNNDRLLLQIQFSDSLFGSLSKTSSFKIEQINTSLKDRIKKYPDIYEFYLNKKFSL